VLGVRSCLEIAFLVANAEVKMSRIYCVCVGAGLLLLSARCLAGGAASPEAAFKGFRAAVTARDGNKAWNLLTKESQDKLNAVVNTMKDQLKKLDDLPPEQRNAVEEQFSRQFGMTLSELRRIDGKGLLVFSLKNIEKFSKGKDDLLAEVASATLEDVRVDGDMATGSVKTKMKTEPIQFRKERGSWRIVLPGIK
jgi:hypothetical protein